MHLSYDPEFDSIKVEYILSSYFCTDKLQRKVIFILETRFVTGEVSSEVMKADECIINARSKLEAVERLLKDKRIGKHLGDEIRRHCLLTQSSPAVDQASLFR